MILKNLNDFLSFWAQKERSDEKVQVSIWVIIINEVLHNFTEEVFNIMVLFYIPCSEYLKG